MENLYGFNRMGIIIDAYYIDSFCVYVLFKLLFNEEGKKTQIYKEEEKRKKTKEFLRYFFFPYTY